MFSWEAFIGGVNRQNSDITKAVRKCRTREHKSGLYSRQVNAPLTWERRTFLALKLRNINPGPLQRKEKTSVAHQASLGIVCPRTSCLPNSTPTSQTARQESSPHRPCASSVPSWCHGHEKSPCPCYASRARARIYTNGKAEVLEPVLAGYPRGIYSGQA